MENAIQNSKAKEKFKEQNKDNKLKKNKKELLRPTIDIVFQSLFNQDNISITKAFAEDLLNEKITSIVINNDKYLIRDNIKDKMGILDLELDINDNEKVDVEIQLVEKKDFIKRLIWYFSKLYSKQIKIGEDYNKIKKVILIAIIDFEIKEIRQEEMETIWKITETKNSQKVLTEDLEIHIIDLKKAKEAYEKNHKNRKAQWILFLDNPNSKEVEKIMEENKGVEEAVVKIRELTEDEKMERIAFLREKAIMDEKAIRAAGYDDGYEEGKEDGREVGRKEGIEKGKKEAVEMKTQIIKNLYSMGMEIENISKAVKMKIEDVKNILKIK